MEEKKGILGKILAFIGIVVAIGGAVLAVLHFWDDIKEKLGCNKCEFEDFDELEDFADDAADELEEAAEELEDEMDDFVEFEEL